MALDTFLAKGYAGASIESIAEAARASKVTIYRQFGNKENLFRAALNLAQQKARSSFQSQVELDGDPEVVLKRIILGLHAGFTTPEYLAMTRLMIAESQRFPEVRHAIAETADFLATPLVLYLSKLKEQGVLNIDSPYWAAMQLGALAMGGVRFFYAEPLRNDAERDRWASSLHKLFWNSWRRDIEAAPAKTRQDPGS